MDVRAKNYVFVAYVIQYERFAPTCFGNLPNRFHTLSLCPIPLLFQILLASFIHHWFRVFTK